MYTQAALHERPDGNGRAQRRKTNGSAAGQPATAVPAAKAAKATTVAAATTVSPAAPAKPVAELPVPAEVADDPLLTAGQGHEHPLLAPPRPAPRRPGLIPTDIADTIGPVLGKAVADIKAHEDGSRRGGDIEDVHKMRVATRRVRAYLKAARPALDRTATDRLRGDVAELAGTLGVIRDNDVMIHRLHIEAGLLGRAAQCLSAALPSGVRV